MGEREAGLSDEVVIRELHGLEEMMSTFPLRRQEAPSRTESLFRERTEAMLAGGFRCIAAYVGDRMVGVSGFWVGTQMWCGKYIEPDGVVVDAEMRSLGIGGKLMDWVEAEGERLGCTMMRVAMVLGKERTKRFYNRNGFSDDGLILVKPLSLGEAEFPEYLQQKRQPKD